MRNILFTLCLICLLGCGSLVWASPEDTERKEVQQSVLQLLENKSCPGCNLSGAKLQRLNLTGANLTGADLSGAKLNLAILIRADLRNANLEGADFSGADLTGADMRGANMIGTVIEGANLAGTKLRRDDAVYTATDDSDLPHMEEISARDSEVELKDISSNEQQEEQEPKGADTDISAAGPLPTKSKRLNTIGDAVVTTESTDRSEKKPEISSPVEKVAKEEQVTPEKNDKPIIEETILPAEEKTKPEAKDQEVVEEQIPASEELASSVETQDQEKVTEDQDIAQKDEPVVDPEAEKKKILVEKLFDENRCVACDLTGVDLSDEDFEEADLERVILRGANLREVDLQEANLKGADLRDTDLRDADLREADLYKADLSGADVTGAKFDEALIDSMIGIGVKGADYRDAIGEPITSSVLKP